MRCAASSRCRTDDGAQRASARAAHQVPCRYSSLRRCRGEQRRPDGRRGQYCCAGSMASPILAVFPRTPTAKCMTDRASARRPWGKRTQEHCPADEPVGLRHPFCTSMTQRTALAGCPSWIHIEPCAACRSQPSGRFWKIFGSCNLLPERTGWDRLGSGRREDEHASRAGNLKSYLLSKNCDHFLVEPFPSSMIQFVNGRRIPVIVSV
jgi:hypothetical protein